MNSEHPARAGLPSGVDLEALTALVRTAGSAVHRFFGRLAGHTVKPDQSPLTEADRTAHRILMEGLTRLAPSVPVLSEEGRSVPYEERRAWETYFLVDPLDGTREFVVGIPEFTVNVALIEEGQPVMGVVYDPVRDRLYVGVVGKEAYVQVGGRWRRLPVEKNSTRPLHVVLSRSDRSPELGPLLERFPGAEVVRVGSSLKFCWVAEGRADFYPRLKPSMEWDTAAGTALVLAAGGQVLDRRGSPIRYNRPDMTNPPFYVVGRGLPRRFPDWRSRLFPEPGPTSGA